MSLASTPFSCETLEAECNVLGMELLNVLEFIGDTIDYRKITLLVHILLFCILHIIFNLPFSPTF